MNSHNSETCIICFNSYKNPTKIFCGHSFCNECILNWSSQSDKCPICRQSFNLSVKHNYNTRQNYHIQNRIENNEPFVFNTNSLILTLQYNTILTILCYKID